MKHVLVFERAMLARVKIREALSELDIKLTEVETETEAMQQLMRGRMPVDLMILDLSSEVGGDFDMVRRFKELSHDLPLVVLAASNRKGDFIAAIRSGATDYILKPYEDEAFKRRIVSLMTNHSPFDKNQKSTKHAKNVKNELPVMALPKESAKTTSDSYNFADLSKATEKNFIGIFEEEFYRAKKGKYPLTVFSLIFHRIDDPDVDLECYGRKLGNPEKRAMYEAFAQEHFEDIRSQLWTSDEIVHMGPQVFYGLLPFCPEDGFERFRDKMTDFLNHDDRLSFEFGKYHWHMTGLTISGDIDDNLITQELLERLRMKMRAILDDEPTASALKS